MSLEAIDQAIEKIAFPIMPGLGAGLKKAFVGKGAPATWKQIGTKAAIGGGVGAVGNVALGDKNQSVAERATKGLIGGGLAGAAVGAGKQAYQTNKGLQRMASRTGASSALPAGHKALAVQNAVKKVNPVTGV